MPDVDTSANAWNPQPTHDELLAIRDRMLARLAAGAPVRLIRVANLKTEAWRQDVRFNRDRAVAFPTTGRFVRFRDRQSDLCEALASTGEHLGLDRVGLVVETVEDVGPRPMTDEELQTAETVVWVGVLRCGCRPLALVDTGSDVDTLRDLWARLSAQCVEVEPYRLEDVLSGRVVAPCRHVADEDGGQ